MSLFQEKLEFQKRQKKIKKIGSKIKKYFFGQYRHTSSWIHSKTSHALVLL